MCYFREKIFYNYDNQRGNYNNKSKSKNIDSCELLDFKEAEDDPYFEERNQLIREQMLDEEMRNVVLSYENDLPVSYEGII